MLIEVLFGIIVLALSLGPLISVMERSMHLRPDREIRDVSGQEICRTISSRPHYALEECETKRKVRLRITYTEQGFTILEVLLSLMLGLGALALIVKSYAVVENRAKELRNWLRQDLIIARIESDLMRTFKAIDTHPFAITPRVHSPGTIQFPDGSANPVMLGDVKFKPASDSNAFSNLRLNTALLSDIHSCSSSGNTRYGQACLRYAASGATSNFQSFALISLNSISEARGQFSGFGRCKNFTVTVGKSMLFQELEEEAACNEKLLVPIDWLQTIYKASNGEFRLLSHRLDQNVENQPLTRSDSTISLQMNFRADLRPWKLEMLVFKNAHLKLAREFSSTMGRSLKENLLLNIL